MVFNGIDIFNVFQVPTLLGPDFALWVAMAQWSEGRAKTTELSGLMDQTLSMDRYCIIKALVCKKSL